MPSTESFIFNGHKFTFYTKGEMPGGVASHGTPEIVGDKKFLAGLKTALELYPYWDAVYKISERATICEPTADDYQKLLEVRSKCPDREFAEYLLDEVFAGADGYRRHRDAENAKSSIKHRSSEGYVYLAINDKGYHKIGRAKNPKARLDGLKKGGVVEYVCLIKSDNYSALESKLHKKFAARREFGEWFNLEPEDIEYIKSLQGE